ncbi:hypothetical protein H1164_15540 [Thermoactinomyces daqus]|uniref:Uncharacterized protein n=1 Tax=Thermoactinomyces daqus TaxID=1329516 RepID=A0A7W1XCQ0_9BACL|nr:hypothetical protein [Thermoactinomyces daqus]MBA4544266.1 hypothetical protein [Thermoactinomyces daqus]
MNSLYVIGRFPAFTLARTGMVLPISDRCELSDARGEPACRQQEFRPCGTGTGMRHPVLNVMNQACGD